MSTNCTMSIPNYTFSQTNDNSVAVHLIEWKKLLEEILDSEEDKFQHLVEEHKDEILDFLKLKYPEKFV